MKIIIEGLFAPEVIEIDDRFPIYFSRGSGGIFFNWTEKHSAEEDPDDYRHFTSVKSIVDVS